MNGDFFEKMWGFLKNSGGDQKWGYLEAEWGFSPKNIWQHWTSRYTSGWDRFQPPSKGPRPGLGLNET